MSLVLSALLLVLTPSAQASKPAGAGDVGVGLQFGYPGTITAKYWLDDESGLVGHVGAWFNNLHIRGVYQRDFFDTPLNLSFCDDDLFWMAGVDLNVYNNYGGGFYGGPGVGGGVGYSWAFNQVPAELYVTIELFVHPLGWVNGRDTYVYYPGGIGCRWYF